jgi:hypothetical protein
MSFEFQVSSFKQVMGRGLLVMAMVLGAGLVRGAEETGGANVDGQRAGVRFFATEVLVDAGGGPVGAYQVELEGGGAVLVGVEGGDGVYGAAPFYDPRALAHGRVVLGAFHVGSDEPRGKVRVARVHWEATGGATAEVTGKVVVVTDEGGKTIDATVRVVPFEGDR